MLLLLALAAVPLALAARAYRDYRREQDAVDYLARRGAVVRVPAPSSGAWFPHGRTVAVQFTQDQFHQSGAEPQLNTADFEHLARLSGLDELTLHGDLLTAEGMSQLVRLETLRSLALLHCPLDDDQARSLAALRNLRILTLEAAGVTETALDDLRRSLPDLEIVDD